MNILFFNLSDTYSSVMHSIEMSDKKKEKFCGRMKFLCQKFHVIRPFPREGGNSYGEFGIHVPARVMG